MDECFYCQKKENYYAAPWVLLGTTRSTVLKLAKKLFRIKFKDITRREVLNADECFVTNAPKGIVPIVKIDGEKDRNRACRSRLQKHLMKEFEKKILT